MSELASLSTEVEALLAELSRLRAPIQQSRAAIRRAQATPVSRTEDRETARADAARRQHLHRADHALHDAAAAASRSTAVAEEWLAQHAARGSGGTGAPPTLADAAPAADTAGGPDAMVAAAIDAAGDFLAGPVEGLEGLPNAHRARRREGLAFGATAAVTIGAADSALGSEIGELLVAIGMACLPVPVGFGAQAALGFLAGEAIEDIAGWQLRTRDAGSPGGWRTWSAAEWAAEAAKAAVPVAVGAALIVSPVPPLVAAALGAVAGGAAWYVSAATHHAHGHHPRGF